MAMLNVGVGRPAFSEGNCIFANHVVAIETSHRKIELLGAARHKTVMKLGDEHR